MRIVFMGSADLACPCLDRLLAESSITVAAVVTQPDRPKGRRLQTAPCAVRAHVAAASVPVLTPAEVNAPEAVAAVRACAPEVIVVVAYGQMLGAELLALPPRGCINVHASLLPRYRGAAPIQWALAQGETRTGVTTMFMDAGLDTGDLIAQAEVAIAPDDTAGTLHDRLALRGAALLMETLAAVRTGACPRRPQPPEGATYAPKLKKSDGRLDWRQPASRLHDRIRAFNPWPSCYCEWPPFGRIRVWRARVEAGCETAAPGDLVEARGEGPLVQTGREALRLLDLQPEGRTPMSGAAFLRGHPLRPGVRLA